MQFCRKPRPPQFSSGSQSLKSPRSATAVLSLISWLSKSEKISHVSESGTRLNRQRVLSDRVAVCASASGTVGWRRTRRRFVIATSRRAVAVTIRRRFQRLLTFPRPSLRMVPGSHSQLSPLLRCATARVTVLG